MGRRDRERIERIRAGLENPIARQAVKVAAREGVIHELQQASTEDQIDALNRLVVGKDSGKLRDALMKNAPAEMDKGIRKMRKDGKEVTVDALCAEIKNTPGFLSMCEKVGLTLGWFEELAKKRMEAHNV